MNSNTRHQVIPRTMCLVTHKDKILLIKASEDKPWVGIYNPVGGHIEASEDILESAKREIWEETTLMVGSVRLAGIVHVTGFFGKNIMMFVTHCEAPHMHTPDSHREGELEW